MTGTEAGFVSRTDAASAGIRYPVPTENLVLVDSVDFSRSRVKSSPYRLSADCITNADASWPESQRTGYGLGPLGTSQFAITAVCRAPNPQAPGLASPADPNHFPAKSSTRPVRDRKGPPDPPDGVLGRDNIAYSRISRWSCSESTASSRKSRATVVVAATTSSSGLRKLISTKRESLRT